MAAALRLTVDAPLELWSIDLSSAPRREDVALLSAAELGRARCFRFDRDRRRYLVAHAALRRLLTTRGAPPALNVPFETNAFGKPRLGGARGPTFSLSYAGDLALVGLSDRDVIGVDIEPLRAMADEDVTSDVFDVTERVAIARERAGPARDSAFLRAWTRKEACVKAVGTGLTTSPASVPAGVDDKRRRLVVMGRSGCQPVEVGSFQIGDRIAAWARVL